MALALFAPRQRIVDKALVVGLRQVYRGDTPEEIARIMPAEHALGDLPLYIQSIRNSLSTYSYDGHFTREGAETALKVLAEFEPEVRGATVNLSQTYDESFVDNALARRK